MGQLQRPLALQAVVIPGGTHLAEDMAAAALLSLQRALIPNPTPLMDTADATARL